MDFSRIVNTAGLFAGSAAFVLNAIATGVEHLVQNAESPITLLKAGAFLTLLSIFITKLAIKIFEKMGWEVSDDQLFALSIFAYLTSSAITSVAAVRFGWTSSLTTGLKVSLIGVQLLAALSCFVLAMDNIYGDANHERLPV